MAFWNYSRDHGADANFNEESSLTCCARPGGGHYATCDNFVPDITPDDEDPPQPTGAFDR